MRTKLTMSVGALVFLSALGHFVAKPLMAQIRAALVKNIDEPGRAPYQSARRCDSSGPTSFCGGLFTPVPSGKRLVIQHVSVSVICNQGPCIDQPIAILTDVGVGPDAPAAYVLPSGSREGSRDQNILLYVEPGGTPAFAAYFNQQPSSARITLTGYLVDLSQ